MCQKVFVCVVLLSMLLSTSPIANAEEPAPDLSFHAVYTAVHEGVVLLTMGRSSCSGWRYGNLIITNYHCVRREKNKNLAVWHDAIGPVDPQGLLEPDVNVPEKWDEERPDREPWVKPEVFKGLPAEVVGIDPDEDLAILLVNGLPDDIVSLTIADPGTVRVGDLAFSMGWPMGLWPTFNMGIITAIDAPLTKYIKSKTNTDLFVADMWINGGNSGGPILNIRGEVIGMACMGLTREGLPTGMNLMVNIKHVEDLLASVNAHARFTGRFVVIPPK